MKHASSRIHSRLCSIVLLVCGTAALAQGGPPVAGTETRRPGLNQDAIDNLSRKHPGYPGALAPENLAKKRPKPPFDLTGTWFVDLRRSFEDFKFGPPYPQFHEAGQQALKEAAEARAKGVPYRDSIGQCYPAGMPMIMTRVWPISMVQMPTVIYMMFNFTNSLRIVYLDGRKHTDPDIAEMTYNGESIGHWEKDALVVHTRYFETNHHWIDEGIPVSEELEIVERIRLLEKGTILEIEYTMTDPKNWKGEWKNTKRWMRVDYSDISEVECLPNLNKDLPSTGSAATDPSPTGPSPTSPSPTGPSPTGPSPTSPSPTSPSPMSPSPMSPSPMSSSPTSPLLSLSPGDTPGLRPALPAGRPTIESLFAAGQ